jgi:hypothetical protein
MDKKDTELLRRLYSELEAKTLAEIQLRYKQRNVKLQEVLSSGIVPSHLNGLDKDTMLLRILSASYIDNVLSVGIYSAFENNNMATLNDALYSYNRLKSNFMITLGGGGYDHCIRLINVVESLAGNDVSFIKKIIPHEQGLTRKGTRFLVTTSNLIISLLYSNGNFKDESIKGADKFLGMKNPKFYIATVRYLVALVKEDPEKATEYLQELCHLYKKATWLHEFKNPFLKVIGIFIHGMFNLSYHSLSVEKFLTISPPEHSVFWKEFLQYTMQNNFLAGKPFITFDSELSGLNKIYE